MFSIVIVQTTNRDNMEYVKKNTVYYNPDTVQQMTYDMKVTVHWFSEHHFLNVAELDISWGVPRITPLKM